MLKKYTNYQDLFEPKCLSISLDQFWDRFLSDSAIYGFDDFYRSLKYENVKLSIWK